MAHPTNLNWVITPVVNGISRVNPLITGVITHLLSGKSHQVLTPSLLPDLLLTSLPGRSLSQAQDAEEHAPEHVPDRMSENMPGKIPDRMPERLSEYICQKECHLVGITRRKQQLTSRRCFQRSMERYLFFHN